MNDAMEKWLPVPNYEGIYEVSNYGHIRSVNGKTTYTNRHGIRIWKQRVLKPKVTTNKYGRQDMRVNLWKDGAPKTFLVARLVAMAWCPEYSDNLTVNHKDGNSLNNTPENLEWLTRRENIKHAFDNGLVHSQIKTILESNGDRLCFKSMSEASRFIGKSSSYINTCIKHNRLAIDTKGKKYNIIIQ